MSVTGIGFSRARLDNQFSANFCVALSVHPGAPRPPSSPRSRWQKHIRARPRPSRRRGCRRRRDARPSRRHNRGLRRPRGCRGRSGRGHLRRSGGPCRRRGWLTCPGITPRWAGCHPRTRPNTISKMYHSHSERETMINRRQHESIVHVLLEQNAASRLVST